MGKNANKIVLVLAVVLVVVAVVLIIGASSCSGGGGGGATGASKASTTGGATGNTPGSATGNTPGGATASSPAAQGTSTAEGYEDMTVDELRALIGSDTAPVGSNARSASTSQGVATAAETYASLKERGLSDVELSADFDIGGNYIGPKVLDRASTDKYPSYMARYLSAKDVAWIIYVNDGNYVACPQGSSAATLSKRVILSESDHVTQYDGDRNEYSEFVLNGLADMRGAKVARIDKATLDSYGFDDLEKM